MTTLREKLLNRKNSLSPIHVNGCDLYVMPLPFGTIVDLRVSMDEFELPKVVAEVLVDQNGDRLFDPESEMDLEQLSQLSVSELKTIFQASVDASVVDVADAKKN